MSIYNLAAETTSTHTLRVRLPNSGGTHYYGICVDSVAGAPSTENNCSLGTLVRIFNPFLGDWQGRNVTKIWISFTDRRHTIFFKIFGIEHNYDCTIMYRYDSYSSSECRGQGIYRRNVQGDFTVSFSNNYDTLRTSGGRGGTRFDK